MIPVHELTDLISYIFNAHADKSKELADTVRKWDGKTPYGIHPTWCAMTLLTETTLPEELRVTGAQTLLLHDILEDTTGGLPDGTLSEVAKLVAGMSFASFTEETELIWEQSQEIRLLKLYDKVSNLLDGSWMSPEKRQYYAEYLSQLCDDVESNYGCLNIIQIARAILTVD